ncbi:MAG: hypothetical protein IPN71_11655 [Fibrobacteres bacterium]|nr:hypothetical protein [Fibrobacterota bacterium]
MKDPPYLAIIGSIDNYLASGKRLGTLRAGSPAIDSGSTKSVLKDDAYGSPRTGRIDIGAVESPSGTWLRARPTRATTMGAGLLNSSHNALGRPSPVPSWLAGPE